ncbi:MAG: hypothetical protein ACE5HT_07180 [Gemmatimonadales bacterium]
MARYSPAAKLDQEHRIVRISVTGVVEAREHQLQYEEITRSYPSWNRLWDFRDADLSQLSESDLASIADFAAQREDPKERPRVALLVGRNVDFGVSRMYEVLAEERYSATFSVFRDEAAAERWLSARDDPED